MIRQYVVPILAVAGIGFGAFTVFEGNKVNPPAPPVVQPSKAPFETFVAGSGIVEANTENISLGTPVAGVVTDVYAKVGDRVKAGQPLFKIDDRSQREQLVVAQTALQQAREQLNKLLNYPRPEDVPITEAQVKQDEATLAQARDLLENYNSLKNTVPGAMVEEEYQKRQRAVESAEAAVAHSRATLAELKAGSWKPDIDIARANVTAADAQVQSAQTELDKLTVRAPVDCQILQVNIRAGEYASIQPTSALMMLGNVEPLHLRVDVDENDAWRVQAGTAAVGFLRGNRDIKTPLTFVRFEPYVVPKTSLTGDTTERVDTRVLQVIYSFNRGDLPIFVGQQMDVFIQAPVSASTAPAIPQSERTQP